MPVALNEEQQVVAGLDKGAYLVDAGAGVGKTTAITQRTVCLVERGADLDRILNVTFTVKAAQEMAKRVFGSLGRRMIWATNFHRLCTRLLRMFPEFGVAEGFTIVDDKESEDLIKGLLRSAAGDADPKKLLPMIGEQIKRNRECELWPGTQDPMTIFGKKDPVIAFVAAAYDEHLRNETMVDFDLMLFKVAIGLHRSPQLRRRVAALWDYVQVDEFQDTDTIQFEILKHITPHGNVLGCGDIDQGIYRWRGAEPKNMHYFIKHFKARVVPLQINYRSNSEILDLANRVIRNNPDRLQKVLQSSKGPGGRVVIRNCQDSRAEAELIAAEVKSLLRAGTDPGQIAVLYRVGASSRLVEQAINSQKIPHRILGGLRFWARKEAKDVVAWAKVLLRRTDWDAYRRATQTPRLGIGDAGWKLVLESEHPEAGLVAHHSRRASGFLRNLGLGRAKGKGAEALEYLLELSGYKQQLMEECAYDSEEMAQRLGNVQEALSAIREIGSIETFLDEVVLGLPDNGDGREKSITLATIHAAKGLEWAHVFIVAVVDEMLPHVLSLRSDDQIAEERRLFYVAITRAGKGLHLTCPTLLDVPGAGAKVVLPSRFLAEAGLSPRGRR